LSGSLGKQKKQKEQKKQKLLIIFDPFVFFASPGFISKALLLRAALRR
jgi:hypothetical protein